MNNSLLCRNRKATETAFGTSSNHQGRYNSDCQLDEREKKILLRLSEDSHYIHFQRSSRIPQANANQSFLCWRYVHSSMSYKG
ncbi:hypothetical protein GRJ2_000922200 [Grus japonensis]|uniref:Uncharacterized protein n=1 Tax=Grus japonensis TaxID=30415 RepID=A0ABC9WID3_GRUJA